MFRRLNASQVAKCLVNIRYVIEIQKGGLVDKFSEAINNNDKLRIEFDRDNFRKFADEYMKKQQDFQASQKWKTHSCC